jgi:hypothetical protein
MAPEKKSLYIETTIPSYATARDSLDLLKLHRQIITRAFWRDERHRFRLCTGEAVYTECGQGDPEAAAKRLEFLNVSEIENLQMTTADRELAAEYERLLGLPERARLDATHLAICVVSRVDYLLTWNCTHLGPVAYEKAREYNDRRGLWTPKLVTPENINETIELEELR